MFLLNSRFRIWHELPNGYLKHKNRTTLFSGNALIKKTVKCLTEWGGWIHKFPSFPVLYWGRARVSPE
jgi:hypothetical protein